MGAGGWARGAWVLAVALLIACGSGGLPGDADALGEAGGPEGASAAIVESVEPAEGPAGALVTVGRQGFGDDPAGVQVEIGMPADLVSGQDDRLRVRVPDLAAAGASGFACGSDGTVTYGVTVLRGGVRAQGQALFRVTGLPLCAPVLHGKPFPAVAAVGDEVAVVGSGFAQRADGNDVDVGGRRVWRDRRRGHHRGLPAGRHGRTR